MGFTRFKSFSSKARMRLKLDGVPTWRAGESSVVKAFVHGSKRDGDLSWTRGLDSAFSLVMGLMNFGATGCIDPVEKKLFPAKIQMMWDEVRRKNGSEWNQEVPSQVPVDLRRGADRERGHLLVISPNQYVFLTDGENLSLMKKPVESDQKRQWF
nr:hypothetical retrotransposon [Ipomoea batatas]